MYLMTLILALQQLASTSKGAYKNYSFKDLEIQLCDKHCSSLSRLITSDCVD